MKNFKVLFFCLGNISMSTSAESIFRKKKKKKGNADSFFIDSAGTSDYHVGEEADKRMQQHAIKRNYHLTSIARQFDPDKDFDQFDLIVAMDGENYEHLKAMARNPGDEQKLVKMTDFSIRHDYDDVPDPYFGGSEGFELVLDLLEDASEGLYEKLTR